MIIMFTITTISSVEGNRIITKHYEHCSVCGSLNIKVSAKGNKYCGEICWKDPKYKRAASYAYMEEMCGGEVCVEY